MRKEMQIICYICILILCTLGCKNATTLNSKSEYIELNELVKSSALELRKEYNEVIEPVVYGESELVLRLSAVRGDTGEDLSFSIDCEGRREHFNILGKKGWDADVVLYVEKKSRRLKAIVFYTKTGG